MNLNPNIRTTYRLGEVCSWSKGPWNTAANPDRLPIEHSYVDIEVTINQNVASKQTIELPTDAAKALVAAMNPVAAMRQLRTVIVDKQDGEQANPILTHWFAAPQLLMVAQVLSSLAKEGTMWLDQDVRDCKYMAIRIDMRGGNFVLQTDNGQDAKIYMLNMIRRWINREKAER